MALKSIIKPRITEAEEAEAAEELAVSASGARDNAIQRLQVGFFGLGAILLLIGVANVFLQRAEMVEDEAVPEAAPTVAAEQDAPQQSDPLADAGVVPELPADPDAEAASDDGEAQSGSQEGENSADDAEPAGDAQD